MSGTASPFARARDAAIAVEEALEEIQVPLRTEVAPAWDIFLAHAASKARLDTIPAYLGIQSVTSKQYDAEITLGRLGATFFLVDYDYESGEYTTEATIPWDFIDPQTRADAETRIKADMVEAKAALDRAAAEHNERIRARKRKADEDELAALARRLGKRVVDH